MSGLSVRDSRHLGNKVKQCQQFQEAAEEESLWGDGHIYIKKPSAPMLVINLLHCRCDRIKLDFFHRQMVYF